jgi:hypothetical protein
MPTFFQEKISQQLGGSNREEEVTNEGGEIRGEMSFRPTKPKTRRTQNLPTRKPAGTKERKGQRKGQRGARETRGISWSQRHRLVLCPAGSTARPPVRRRSNRSPTGKIAAFFDWEKVINQLKRKRMPKRDEQGGVVNQSSITTAPNLEQWAS